MSSASLIQLFDKLVQETASLITEIKQSNKGFWLPIKEDLAPNAPQSLDLACSLMQDFWYQDGQDGRETRSCFGFITLESSTLSKANEVNALKEQFKNEVQTIQKANKETWLTLKGELARRHPSLQAQLHFSGLSRLHLKQTWRTLSVIERSPIRIGFNWYQSGRSIKKISVQQAYDELSRLSNQGTHTQVQLDAISKLASNTPLAKVQNLAPTMRANLFFDDTEGPSRLAMNISLPILIKANNEQILPKHNTPSITAPKDRVRAVRSDRKIEDTPFLPSIRVHKYN